MERQRHYIHGDPCEANDGTYYSAAADLFVPLSGLDLGETGLKRYEWTREIAETRSPARFRVVWNAKGNPYLWLR
jgi:hypothetical protein